MRSMGPGGFPVLWLVVLASASLSLVACYPSMAGSCEGVFSGNHVLPEDVGKKRGDGGWKFQVVLDKSRAGSTKAATVSVVNDDPQAWFIGFLLKSFDLETGEYIGTFSKLPQGAEHFEGCPVPAAAVNHNGYGFWNGKEQALTVEVEWPSDRELGFVIFPVATMFEWYQVHGSTTGLQPAKGLHKAVLDQGIYNPRLDMPAWALLHFGLYAPIILLVAVGVLAKSTNGPGGVGAKINHTVPISRGPLILQISIGEWLSFLLFVLVQAVVLALMVRQIEHETTNLPYSEYNKVKYYPNPWDAAVGRALGRLLQGNLALTLLLPTRNSVWPALVGISFERFVKYHRVMGRWTFVNLVSHFVAMWVVYDVDCLTTRRTRWGYGNLYGLLAGISTLLTVLSAAEPIRRKSYELFLALHMMAVPALVFAVMHVNDTLMHFLVPLVLYSLDWALRIYQWTRSAKVVAAEAQSGCTWLRVHCPAVARGIWEKKAAGIGSFVYLQASSVDQNPLAWHPFSVSGLETVQHQAQVGGVGDHVAPVPDCITINVRDLGSTTWSGGLHAAVKQKVPLALRVEGPYGHMGIDLRKYSCILAVSGGVGFTPTGPLLQMVLDAERRKACLPLLRCLHVVWVVRSADHLLWFHELLSRARAMASQSDVSLRLDLFVTGRAPQQEDDPHVLQHSGADVAASLGARTGRPSWADVLDKVQHDSKGEAVAATICGPQTLTAEAAPLLRKAGCHTHIETFML